jgi:hypothetical protein
MRMISVNNLGMKKSYWVVLGGSCLVIVTGLIYFKFYKANTSKPQPMAHSLEYDAVVDEHIDTSKLSRNEVDLAATMQVVSQRFAVYQFNHQKLRGKWGDLNVIVDRQTGKSVSRSLLPVNKAQPVFALSSLPECLMAEQPDQKSYEICVR